MCKITMIVRTAVWGKIKKVDSWGKKTRKKKEKIGSKAEFIALTTNIKQYIPLEKLRANTTKSGSARLATQPPFSAN